MAHESNPVSPICEGCNDRPANHFVTRLVHGVEKQTQLCDSCFSAVDPDLERRLDELLKQGVCKYCGAQAQVAMPEYSLISRQAFRGVRLLCFDCSKTYNEFVLSGLQSLPTGLSDEAERGEIEKLDMAAEKHMREHLQ